MPRPYGNPKQLEKRRYRAIELLKRGMPVLAVARQLNCARSAVYQWRENFRDHGRRGLKPKPTPGRPAKLRASQKRQLTTILLRGAPAYGYATELWTQRRIAQVIRKEFGVDYHPNHLWRFLVRLGWSCQKPEERARERNEEKIRRWKRWVWPHIKKGQTPRRPPRIP